MPSGSSTTVQKNEPWAEAQPALKRTIAEGQRLYDSGVGFNSWGGPTLADLDPRTTAALDETGNIASGMGGLLGKANYNFANNLVANNGITGDQRAAMSGLLDTASGKYLDQPNPYLQKMLDANSANVANNVNAAASSAGRYGSGAHTGVLTKELTNATLPVLSQNYENERQRQIAASGQAAGLFGQGADRALQTASMGSELTDALYDPSRRMGAIGDFYGGRSQANLDALIAKFNQDQAAPWQRLGALQNVAQGIGGMGGTAMQTSPGNSGLTNALGTAATFMSIFSDRNEKTDIEKLGKDPNTGLDMYAYRYKNDPKTYPKVVGPMAQDIEKTFPNSTKKIGGKLVVTGGLLG
jgi:hypothetical protein